tara:strand:+ start:4377 stop:4631 length:255 start_codon:yes stop_codon:yes gene_type:complete
LTAVATGNVLSTARNWLLGCSIQRYRQNRYFPGSESTLQKAQQACHRFGRWLLLLIWIPIIGDPLIVVADPNKATCRLKSHKRS